MASLSDYFTLVDGPRKYRGHNLQTGTSYDLALDDMGKLVEMNNASTNTCNIPTNATVPFPEDARIDVGMGGAGQTSITGSGGVTLRGDIKVAAQYKIISLWQRSIDEWWIIGGVA